MLRTGGSTGYQQAVSGLNDGVDGRGSTMNSFLGVKVLTDLLLMGKCGVFVDNPILPEHRLSDAQGLHPYLYSYQLEDIINFATTKPESPSEFKAVLLRDTTLDFDGVQGLPSRTVQRYRSLWINDQGTVSLQMYDDKGEADGEERVLELTKIPFVLLDIGDSLIKDVCHHQIALLNLGSQRRELCTAGELPVLHTAEGRPEGSANI